MLFIKSFIQKHYSWFWFKIWKVLNESKVFKRLLAVVLHSSVMYVWLLHSSAVKYSRSWAREKQESWMNPWSAAATSAMHAAVARSLSSWNRQGARICRLQLRENHAPGRAHRWLSLSTMVEIWNCPRFWIKTGAFTHLFLDQNVRFYTFHSDLTGFHSATTG